ncbi:hypothetical protein Tco_0446228, partial [Tanacetum coccineum]
ASLHYVITTNQDHQDQMWEQVKWEREKDIYEMNEMVVEIDPYLDDASLDYVCSHGESGASVYYLGVLFLAMMMLLRLCIYEFAITIRCWIVKVVISSDLNGAARQRVCGHAVFDASSNRMSRPK